MGILKLNVEDKKELIPVIIDFLHGKPLVIDTNNAKDLCEMAHNLGIPMLEEYAMSCIMSESNIKHIDKEYETVFTPKY